MERRFLPKLHDRGKRCNGVFCTLWEGWKCRKDMEIKIMYRGQPKKLLNFNRNTSGMRIPKGPGVYAILYYPSRADDSKGGFKFQVQRVNDGAVAHRLPGA